MNLCVEVVNLLIWLVSRTLRNGILSLILSSCVKLKMELF